MMDKKYPNNLKGAIQLLRDESTLELSRKPTGIPDPAVEGVWKIDLDPELNDGHNCVIVYLCGYKDPFKVIRPHNDFECGICK